jgi:hypothetical protein
MSQRAIAVVVDCALIWYKGNVVDQRKRAIRPSIAQGIVMGLRDPSERQMKRTKPSLRRPGPRSRDRPE